MDDVGTGSTGPRPRRAVARRLGYVGLVAVAGAAFVGGWLASAGEPSPGDEPELVLLDQPPVVATPARPARATRLRPDARVIGVTVGGRHRAYVLSALKSIRRHVVNDQLAGVPVTVSYCDRTDCAVAYTTAGGQAAPLDLSVGGWSEAGPEAGMLVTAGGHRYRQASGQPLQADAPPFPYQVVAVEKTTWAEWRAAHPDTDVCGD